MEKDEPLSVLLIDIDHFKKFNDNFGHGVGDQVLRLVAKALRERVRENDLPARYGGEELIAVLPCADLDDLRRRSPSGSAARSRNASSPAARPARCCPDHGFDRRWHSSSSASRWRT